ncbi:6-phosphogluconolactonase [Vibrio sp. V27_P1S3P104]|uniref:6-phosphogluconolactonase n=1 Tax=Vibrio TaxID=662 RepID=UPI000C16DBED|nr:MULTISPECIES: 6-phosphogluconolactonase [Vibrio]NAW68317.1 6-phosphogluconolactonase [Vibrio sp. V28_P6S34P95]NAX03957.1 6-phosphogluconolactonase [Vibrio sp. V30_P3S12P165]NAX34739.1 6-phosphogluconolactonase [Vibrio sp. V29_P1S30P107]NAX36829.1 6-phosphogluconolactonase [Vibrio sp. V27_P1S3P104]NAX39635.1 6-phosphogluconolactonase [Vibrio sp. V26_P1S5P106]
MIKNKIFPTANAVVESLAKDLQAYSQQGQPIHISLSGGSTPKMLFKLLASQPYASNIQWQNLHFWWGDERCVAPDDAESNYGEANTLLFSQINIPAENIHRILGENEPHAEAKRFAEEMTQIVPVENGVPVFDWILLGVGADGHTASLFPNLTNYQDEQLSVVATHPESGQLRISKTAKVLEAAKRISYLVLGSSKAEIVHQIHTTPAVALPYPAAKIQSSHGATEWYLDLDAAAKIA